MSESRPRRRPPLAAQKKSAPPPPKKKKPALTPGFWRGKALEEFSPEEWEALCDGCGKCCLLKLEDIDTGRVGYTSVACRLFDGETCRCGNYALRKQLVSQCVQLDPATVRAEKDWMPRTCAYRLIAEGYDLYPWHPLVSGDAEAMHRLGHSVRGWSTPEYEIDPQNIADYVLDETI